MASYKILGQAHLTTTSPTDVYTVPASTETIVSTIVIANITGSATTFTIAIREDGDTLDNRHYIANSVPVAANDSTALTLGVALEATDIVTCQAGDADALSFNLFGAEVTV
jgi:hypothetical protein